jgi:acetolactate synthase small subunit
MYFLQAAKMPLHRVGNTVRHAFTTTAGCALQVINEDGMLSALAGVPARLAAGASSVAGVEADVAYAEKLVGVCVKPSGRVKKAVQQARTQVNTAKFSMGS